jgi:hypothetical protein
LLQWHDWAARKENLSDWERDMCRQLYRNCQKVIRGDRATLGDLSFCSTRVELHKSSCDSLIMIESYVGGGYEVGQVIDFFELLVPVSETTSEPVNIVHADWFGKPSRISENTVIGCPVVSTSVKADPDGNCWGLQMILKTKVALAPHHTAGCGEDCAETCTSNAHVWQVLPLEKV